MHTTGERFGQSRLGQEPGGPGEHEATAAVGSIRLVFDGEDERITSTLELIDEDRFFEAGDEPRRICPGATKIDCSVKADIGTTELTSQKPEYGSLAALTGTIDDEDPGSLGPSLGQRHRPSRHQRIWELERHIPIQ
ncbi:MAG TPA: hypothetical protein VGJ86_09035 [Acidimicrobiales bacterium]